MRTTRKRSAAITLVLAGSAALSGCSEPESQRDVYTGLDDCTKDWGNPTQCEPVRDGRHSASYFYGPRYYGTSFPSGRPRPSPNALEASFAGRGGGTQIAGADRSAYSGTSYSSGSSRTSSTSYSSGGSRSSASSSSSSGGSTASRGGFGSSAHASSSGG
jgi:uncharacterized protein YgiB involved in biofilm formation